MVLLSTEGRVLEANDAFAAFLGRRREDLSGLDLAAVSPADDRARAREGLAALLSGAVPVWRAERRYLRPDGTVVHGEVSARVVRDPAGGALGFFGQVQDFTARLVAEEGLRASEEMFRVAMDQAPIGMALVAPDGRWLRVNRALCGLVGRSEAELLSLGFQDITDPADLDADLRDFHRLLSGELDRYQMDKRYVRPDGSRVWVRLTTALIRDADGSPLHVVCQVENLSEERRSLLALREGQRRAQTLVDAAERVLSVQIRNLPTPRVQSISAAVETMLGRSAEEFVANPPQLVEIVHPDDQLKVHELLVDPQRWASSLIPIRCFRPDGSLVWTELRAVPVLDDGGSVVGLDALLWDVTARREAELALMASERRYRALVQHGDDVTLLRDADGTIRYVSPAVTGVLGYNPEELLGAWGAGLRASR